MSSTYHPALHAAAEALCAARVAAAHLGASAIAPAARRAGCEPGVLARQLTGKAAFDDAVAASVRALLAACEDLVTAGCETWTDWTPKSACGDEVTEWEPWTRTRLSPEAERLRLVAQDLRAFLESRDRVRDLIAAEAAVGALRRERSA